MKRTLTVTLLVLACLAVALQSEAAKAEQTLSAGWYAVRAFGARGDGVTKDTQAVQAAVDACAAAGGGTVCFAAGTYMCGSLHLRDNLTLWLDAGATIKGIRDVSEYDPCEQLSFKNDSDRETSFFHHALLWGEGLHDVAIIGAGIIDSNWDRRLGPKAIALKRCQFVTIRDIRILNIPNYAISLLGTDNVNIDGVTILNGFADGIDPDASRNVRISNCHIETYDDAIVPKASFSLGERRSTENITVTNCYLATCCNAFKLGTESAGDFKRIAVSNCVMAGLPGRRPAISGIALESVDGAHLDGVVVSNVTMVDVSAPIFIRLGNRGRDAAPGPGSLRNVSISNVVATGASLSCSITGILEKHVENVALSNIQIAFKGGWVSCPATEEIPELFHHYPDADMWDALPTYGLYVRHVDGLTLSNLGLAFDDGFWRLLTTDKKKIQWITPDGVPQPSAPGKPGHAIVCDDVSRLCIDGLRARPAPEGDAVVRFANVRDALIRGCSPEAGTKVFLEIVGPETNGVSLIGNDLTRAAQAILQAADVKRGVVAVAGNLGG